MAVRSNRLTLCDVQASCQPLLRLLICCLSALRQAARLPAVTSQCRGLLWALVTSQTLQPLSGALEYSFRGAGGELVSSLAA
jgi:hypothetical protein